MKRIVIATMLAIGIAGSAYAEEKKAPTPQQERMATCNKQAGDKGLKGDERKTFMSACLKGEKAAAQPKK